MTRYLVALGPIVSLTCLVSVSAPAPAQTSSAINPFGGQQTVRQGAVPGYVELSDDTILPGRIHLTRDKRLKIADRKLQRQREIPLRKIKKIQCHVEKAWMQRQWRFRENANNEKVYTGERYPARIYVHTITLTDGREIRGDLSGVVYLERNGQEKQKFVLHKRGKGPVGSDLESLVYVRCIKLGPDALREAKERREKKQSRNSKP